jgi:hypothetical protein
MMTRAWLILADILLHLFLFFSLIVFMVKDGYMPKEETIIKEDRFDVKLEDRLALFSAKIGDPVFIRLYASLKRSLSWKSGYAPEQSTSI